MERVSVLFLSLLLCSLSGAELQDNAIIEQREVSPESVNVPEPQPCPSDLHAVLREVSVKLAENRLMIQQLQTLNQEQNAKYEVRMEQLQTHDQEQAAKLRELKNQVDTQQQVGQVAFSASLVESGSGTLGPFNAHTTLEFKHVVSNIGKAYSPHTGFFTAPVRGAYHFEFYIIAHGGSHSSWVVLMKNGEHVFSATERQSDGWGTAANGVTLLLEAGDVVFLRLWHNAIIYDSESHYSSFSGHLLFPM